MKKSVNIDKKTQQPLIIEKYKYNYYLSYLKWIKRTTSTAS